MSRPRKTNRSVDVHVMVPEDLFAEINLLLFSPLQNRVPLGHLSTFFEHAARHWLRHLNGEISNEG